MKSSLADWKERAEALIPVCLSSSAQVESGPCLLVDISISAVGAAVGLVLVLEGIGSNAPALLVLAVPVSGTHFQQFHPPFKVKQGLYVTIASANTYVTLRRVALRE